MLKRNKKVIAYLIIVCVLFACTKNEARILVYDNLADKAYVRFALVSPGTPSTIIKVNDVKVSGSTTSGTFGLFPAISNTPDYAAVPPNGTLKLSLVNSGTPNDSVVIFNGAFAVDAKKFYSVTLADTGIDRTVFSIPIHRCT